MGRGSSGRSGVLGKLKGMVKKLHPAAPGGDKYPPREARSRTSTAPVDEGEDEMWRKSDGGAAVEEEVPLGLQPVYVGKSRRRYLISSRLVDHPLLRVLAKRGGADGNEGGDTATPATVVSCEVVLFDHLLWMIENADPQAESLDELIEFYAI